MDVEAGGSVPRGLTQRFSRKHSEVETFVQLSPDQNIPLMPRRCQASFHAWLLPRGLHGTLWRGGPLPMQERVPGCRVLLHPRCMAGVGGAAPEATRLHLLFCVWTPSWGNQGAEKDALFPGLIPEGSWETVKAQLPQRTGGAHHPTVKATASMSSLLLCALDTVLGTMPGISHRSAGC